MPLELHQKTPKGAQQMKEVLLLQVAPFIHSISCFPFHPWFLRNTTHVQHGFFFLSSYLKANSISSIVRYFDNRQTIQIVLWCQKHPLSFKRATTVYESVCKTSGWILLMKFINQIYICMFVHCVKIWIKLFL